MAGKRKGIRHRIKGQALRELKSAVRQLKNKGLVAKRVDARKYPTRYMQTKVRSLAPVLEGKLSPIRRSAKIAREYKAAGFKVVNNRLLLPPEQAASVRHKKSEYLTLEKMTRAGTIDERVVLPVGVTNIESFLANEGRIDALLGPDQKFAFTFYGNSSIQTYADAFALATDLRNYLAINNIPETAWRHLVLYRIKGGGRAAQWTREGRERQAAARQRKRPRRLLANGRENTPVRRHPITQEEVRTRDRLAKQRARATRSEEAREAYRKSNRERMRKIRGTKRPRK